MLRLNSRQNVCSHRPQVCNCSPKNLLLLHGSQGQYRALLSVPRAAAGQKHSLQTPVHMLNSGPCRHHGLPSRRRRHPLTALPRLLCPCPGGAAGRVPPPSGESWAAVFVQPRVPSPEVQPETKRSLSSFLAPPRPRLGQPVGRYCPASALLQMPDLAAVETSPTRLGALYLPPLLSLLLSLTLPTLRFQHRRPNTPCSGIGSPSLFTRERRPAEPERPAQAGLELGLGSW